MDLQNVANLLPAARRKDVREIVELIAQAADAKYLPGLHTDSLHDFYTAADPDTKKALDYCWRAFFVASRLGVSAQEAMRICCMTRVERSQKKYVWELEVNAAVQAFRYHVKRTGTKYVEPATRPNTKALKAREAFSGRTTARSGRLVGSGSSRRLDR